MQLTFRTFKLQENVPALPKKISSSSKHDLFFFFFGHLASVVLTPDPKHFKKLKYAINRLSMRTVGSFSYPLDPHIVRNIGKIIIGFSAISAKFLCGQIKKILSSFVDP
jgi:hypothetical protein